MKTNLAIGALKITESTDQAVTPVIGCIHQISSIRQIRVLASDFPQRPPCPPGSVLGFLRRSQQNLARERLRSLRHDHANYVGNVCRLQHLAEVLAGMWT